MSTELENLLILARQRRNELQAELEELDQFIATAPRILALLHPNVPVPTRDAGGSPIQNNQVRIGGLQPGPASLGTETSKRNSSAEILDAVEEFLSNADTPIPPSSLIELLEGRGISVGGQRPPNNLSAMLSYAKDRFQNVGRQGWILKRRAEEFFDADEDAEGLV